MSGFKKTGKKERPGLLGKLKSGLDKTRAVLFYDLGDLFQGKTELTDGLLEEMETRLIMADVGLEATESITRRLRQAKKSIKNEEGGAYKILKEVMLEILSPLEQSFVVSSASRRPAVLLVVGVNGVGKTTSIGKLTHYFKSNGSSVLLAAGDTFRAAAIEQIQSWGEKTDTPVIAQKSGADPAAVIYDALHSARSRQCDLLIADTAGRLHNKDNLMEELHKVRRTIDKFDPDTVVEVMLVLDACTGQNALNQARQFNASVGVTGITLTKLDGTAKGGIVFALASQLGIPLRFIGVGEKLDDLRPFEADTFIEALLSSES